MLGEHEALTLAVLLDALATGHPSDPLGAPARQQAALLRRRVAEARTMVTPSGPSGLWARRDAGGDRDDAADRRDILAGERDRHAGERDDLAGQRQRQADLADEAADESEHRLRGLLSDAELRDTAAADHAARQPPTSDRGRWQQWQLDREMSEADRVSNAGDRVAIRSALSRSRDDREAARRRRDADAQDRLASSWDRRSSDTDREGAAQDRRDAHADRDQGVIDTETQAPAQADREDEGLT